MSGVGTGYDLYPTTFSPDGKLFQIEYAQKAVDNSDLVIALSCSDGVVVAVTKPIVSRMMVPGSNNRVFTVGDSYFLTVAGVTSDGMKILKYARKEYKSYKDLFGRKIPLRVLVKRISTYVQTYTLYATIRPFGTAIFLGSWNEEDGPELWIVNVDSVPYKYFGYAMGKGFQEARNEIGKLNLKEFKAGEEGVDSCLKIIKGIYQEKKTDLGIGKKKKETEEDSSDTANESTESGNDGNEKKRSVTKKFDVEVCVVSKSTGGLVKRIRHDQIEERLEKEEE